MWGPGMWGARRNEDAPCPDFRVAELRGLAASPRSWRMIVRSHGNFWEEGSRSMSLSGSSSGFSSGGSVFVRQFFHGTRADLVHGDLIVAGYTSNYGDGKPLSWVYFTGTLDAAIWGAELATGAGRERIYLVEPTGPLVDDPNLTDKKFPGNPTLSYRSRDPLRVVGEVTQWQGHSPEQLQCMRENMHRAKSEGCGILD